MSKATTLNPTLNPALNPAWGGVSLPRHSSLFSKAGFSVSEGSSLLRLAAPMTATALVNMGMSITDVVMMGQIGPSAVAAGAIVSDFYSIVFYLGAGVIAASATEIAQGVGAKRSHEVRRATQQGIWVAAILSVFLFAALWFTGNVLGAFGIEPAIVEHGRAYAHWMALTAMPMMGVALWRNVYGAMGLPKVFLAATLLALPTNAALDYFLMFGGFGWSGLGLEGAGVASAIVAFAIMGGLALYAQFGAPMRGYHFLTRMARPDLKRIGELVRVGLPIGVSNLAEMGVFLLSTIVAGLFGVKALAAHAITLRLCGAFYAIPVGLSQSAAVRSAQAIGRDDDEGFSTTARTAIYIGGLTGLVTCLGVIASGDNLAWLFLDSADSHAAEVAARVTPLLLALGILQIGTTIGVVANGVLRGLKDTKIPMILGWISYWGVGSAVALTFIFAANGEVTGLWAGLATGSTVAALLSGHRVFRSLKGRT